MQLLLPEDLIKKSGSTDPIMYYRRRLGSGGVFRRRIEMGLKMIPPLRMGARILEVGYGAGLVLYNLSGKDRELHGLDLDADPCDVAQRLAGLGIRANLKKGSVLDVGGIYPQGYFDVVVSFSTLEHIRQVQRALDEMDRVTIAGGYLLLGMPAVNRLMEFAFRAIGFKNIKDHHVSTPRDLCKMVHDETERWETQHRKLPQRAPFGAALYHVFLLHKRHPLRQSQIMPEGHVI